MNSHTVSCCCQQPSCGCPDNGIIGFSINVIDNRTGTDEFEELDGIRDCFNEDDPCNGQVRRRFNTASLDTYVFSFSAGGGIPVFRTGSQGLCWYKSLDSDDEDNYEPDIQASIQMSGSILSSSEYTSDYDGDTICDSAFNTVTGTFDAYGLEILDSSSYCTVRKRGSGASTDELIEESTNTIGRPVCDAVGEALPGELYVEASIQVTMNYKYTVQVSWDYVGDDSGAEACDGTYTTEVFGRYVYTYKAVGCVGGSGRPCACGSLNETTVENAPSLNFSLGSFPDLPPECGPPPVIAAFFLTQAVLLGLKCEAPSSDYNTIWAYLICVDGGCIRTTISPPGPFDPPDSPGTINYYIQTNRPGSFSDTYSDSDTIVVPELPCPAPPYFSQRDEVTADIQISNTTGPVIPVFF